MNPPEEETPMHSAEHDAAVEAYFHQTHRERHNHRDRRARRLLGFSGVVLLTLSGLALAGLFGLTTPWYLIKVSQIIVCLDVASISTVMIVEAVRGGRHG
jgi:hypothetical protein